MNFKTKTFAFVAGTAFALSSAFGVAANEAGSGTSAVLGDNKGEGAVCSVEVTSGENVSFGTYTWNAEQQAYVSDGESDNTGTLTATFKQTIGQGERECSGTFEGSALDQVGEEASGSIAANLVSVDGDGILSQVTGTLAGDPQSFAGGVSSNTAGTSGSVNLELNQMLNASYEPGTYQGTVTITMDDAP